jgi:uncharacterized membrane protein YjjP (DUF1212 family)
MATPTSLVAAFGADGAQHQHLVRARVGEVHLEKLSDVYSVAVDVAQARMSITDGAREVDRITNSPSRYASWHLTVAFGAMGSAFSTLVGGGFTELWVACIVGLAIGALAVTAGRFPLLAQSFDLVAAVVASFLAHAGAYWVAPQPMSAYTVTVAGLIVLIPGLSLTLSMLELSTGHLVCGTSRFMGVVVSFMKLGFGVALGARLAAMAFPMSAVETGVSQPSASLPAWATAVALLVACTAFVVLLEGRFSDWFGIAAVAALGMGGAHLGAGVLGADLGPLLSAFLVCMGSYTYSHLTRKLSLTAMVPGLILQVPGSLAYRSVAELFGREVISGVETAFTVTSIAVAMVAGLLLANAVWPVSQRRLV